MTMNFVLLVALAAILHHPLAAGQREREGCYDVQPLVCDETNGDTRVEDPTTLEALGMDYAGIERTCRRLAMEVFPSKSVYPATHLHREYLNSIDASDELCSDIQIAYKYCTFCQAPDYQRWCMSKSAHFPPVCGGQLSRQDILANKTYTLFNIDEDIDDTCNVLQEAYSAMEDPPVDPKDTSTIGPGGMGPPPGQEAIFGTPPPLGGPPGLGQPPPPGGPPGLGLPPPPEGEKKSMLLFSTLICERQAVVRHVCPGECDGKCFTKDNPPTCAAVPSVDEKEPGGTLPGSHTSRSESTCRNIYNFAFKDAPATAVLNTSKHLEYLRGIPEDDPLCPRARRDYSKCLWCNFTEESLCFNKDFPATCEAPSEQPFLDSNGEEIDFQAVDQICQDIFTNMFDVGAYDIRDNPNSHNGHIFIRSNTTRCEQARKFYHKCFWCAPDDVPKGYCMPSAECNSTLNSEINLPPNFASKSPTLLEMGIEAFVPEQHCGLLTPQDGRAASLSLCYDKLFLARACADQLCPIDDPSKLVYLGASTTAQKRAIIWLSRVAALLSFLGASYILYDSLTDPKARKTIYNQLLIGIAIFDIVTAVAWCFATAPIDATATGSDHVEGAMGSKATCITQGFFVQLGFGSIFYNVSLATYYVLVIAHGWREFQLKTIRPLLHGIPVALGFGLAFGGIPIYGFIEYGCHIPPGSELWIVLVFVILPLGLSIAAITAAMFVVYCKVRQRAGASRKWSLGIGQASRMEQAVFWQCLFYVFAFYVTWPILFCVYLFSVDKEGPLGLALTVAFVAPLQGFSNFLVYIRPKLMQKLSKPLKVKVVSRSSASSSFSLALMMQNVFPKPLFRTSTTSRKFSENEAPIAVDVETSGNEQGERKESSVKDLTVPASSIFLEDSQSAQNDFSIPLSAAEEVWDVRMTDPSVALAHSKMETKSSRRVLPLASTQMKSLRRMGLANTPHEVVSNSQLPTPDAEKDEQGGAEDNEYASIYHAPVSPKVSVAAILDEISCETDEAHKEEFFPIEESGISIGDVGAVDTTNNKADQEA